MTGEQHQTTAAAAGAAIYTKRLLLIYDLAVIKVSNRLAWRCPAHRTLSFYNHHISANHLEIGVGTGYYLDRCHFPTSRPRLVLLDLNPNSLTVAARRLRRYNPTIQLANVMEPMRFAAPAFDSIALNYVLHCLSGTMRSKQVVFDNLTSWLNSQGVLFGTTILGQDIHPNWLARKLMKLYNAKAIFSNSEDTLTDLEAILRRSFRSYSIQVVGCVAFFTGRI